MDIKQLQCFVAVAESLNFTLAAHRLYLSQPSLSRHIQDLEKELGILLFNRNKKIVSLTEEGVYFLSAAQELLGISNNILNTAKCLREGMLGSIKIGYQGSARNIIPKYLSSFDQKYPKILVSIEQQGARQLFKSVLEGKIDIAFAFSVIREGNLYSDILTVKTLFNDTMSIFMSKEKAKKYKGRDKISLKELEKETFIQIDRTVNPAYFDVLHKLYLNNNFYPKKIIETHLIDTLMLLIESGTGVSLLPQESTLQYNQNVCFIHIDYPNTTLPIEAIWRTKNANPCLPLLLKEL